MRKRARGKRGGAGEGLRLLEGLGISVGVSAAAIVLFALLILWLDLGEDCIAPVNQFIKVGSILSGTLFACHGPLKGYRAGPLLGLLYMALGVGLYCAFDGRLLPMTVIAGDLGLGAAAGLLSGLLASTMKKDAAAGA